MLFYKNLKILEKYRGMYLPSNTLDEATSFVAGMDMMLENSIGREFREWLIAEKMHQKSPFSWPKLIELYLDELNVSSEKKVDAFLTLLFEFIEGREAKGSPISQPVKEE